MNQYLTYIIGQGDILETIAQSQLGDSSDSIITSIVSLNNLRYPYISDEPIDQFAQKKGTLQYISSISSGSVEIILGNNNSLVAYSGDTLFLQDYTTGLYESVTIKTSKLLDNGQIDLTFSSGLKNSYSSSVILTLFTNQQNISTVVLKTGDTLYLPATSPDIFTVNQSLSDIFGTDIKLDDEGYIQKSNGDFSTVSGIDNVGQAVTLRWKTPIGELPGDNEYGNRFFEIIGEVNKPYFLNLALTFLKQSALSDPRVNQIKSLTLTPNSDYAIISSEIVPVSSNNITPVLTALTIGG